MPRTALALVLFLCSGIAAACICAPPEGTPEQAAESALAKSDVVALMKIRNIRKKRLSPDTEPVLVAEFEPLELFKGKNVQPSYLAKVRQGSHDRLLKIEAGMRWLVYVRKDQMLDFTSCSPSGPADQMEGQLTYLRRRAKH